MSDLHERLRTLDYLPQPDMWSEIEARAVAVTPPQTRSSPARHLFAPLALGGVAVAAILMGAALWGSFIGPSVGNPQATTPAQATPSATARPSPSPSAPGMRVGEHRFFTPPWPSSTGSTVHYYTFTVPSTGWEWIQTGAVKGSDSRAVRRGRASPAGEQTFVRMWGQEVNYDGACADHPLLPADWSLAEFVADLRLNPDVRVGSIVDETVGGYPARVATFTLRRACDTRDGWSSYRAGQMFKIWAVDIDGDFAFFTAVHLNHSDDSLVAEADQIIDSIRFVDSGSSPLAPRDEDITD